jgi:hypothetical protein
VEPQGVTKELAEKGGHRFTSPDIPGPVVIARESGSAKVSEGDFGRIVAAVCAGRKLVDCIGELYKAHDNASMDPLSETDFQKVVLSVRDAIASQSRTYHYLIKVFESSAKDQQIEAGVAALKKDATALPEDKKLRVFVASCHTKYLAAKAKKAAMPQAQPPSQVPTVIVSPSSNGGGIGDFDGFNMAGACEIGQ